MAKPKPVGRAVVNTITTKSIFKIHPAIGMGRVGNSNDFFLGSEKPTKGPVGADAGQGTATPPYRDGGGKVKRQAARFYVFHSPWNAKTSKFPIRASCVSPTSDCSLDHDSISRAIN